uniref:Glycosyltransferase 2-like domain-containing protein n=1 Tax=viral metagenome TaxID=1070528 RepID=A0A6C0CMI8_9ZZZZ
MSKRLIKCLKCEFKSNSVAQLLKHTNNMHKTIEAEMLHNLKPGLSFIIRAKNEEKNVDVCLGSLIKSVKDLPNIEIIFVDNNSTDKTLYKAQRWTAIYPVKVYSYPYEVCKIGRNVIGGDKSKRTLATFYNWCLSKATRYNIVKWDADFIAQPSFLLQMINKYSLHTRNDHFSLWFTGITLFEHRNQYYKKIDSHYDEFRVFSKLYGFKWKENQMWEYSVAEGQKLYYKQPLFFEIKRTSIQEFNTRADLIDSRDKEDHKIYTELKRSRGVPSVDGVEPLRLDFSIYSFENAGRSNGAIRDITKKALHEATFNDLERYVELPGARKIIPRLIHFVWIGNKPLPGFVKECIQQAKNLHPDYEIRVWGNDDIDSLRCKHQLNQFEEYAQKADIIRYEILEHYGGIDLDTDMYCLKNLDDIIGICEKMFAGMCSSTKHLLVTCNENYSRTSCSRGFIATTPRNPILKRASSRDFSFDIRNKEYWHKAALVGPTFFHSCFSDDVLDSYRINLPIDCFYPISYDEAKMTSITTDERLREVKKRHFQSFTYGVHLWAQSWIPKNPVANEKREDKIGLKSKYNVLMNKYGKSRR